MSIDPRWDSTPLCCECHIDYVCQSHPERCLNCHLENLVSNDLCVDAFEAASAEGKDDSYVLPFIRREHEQRALSVAVANGLRIH